MKHILFSFFLILLSPAIHAEEGKTPLHSINPDLSGRKYEKVPISSDKTVSVQRVGTVGKKFARENANFLQTQFLGVFCRQLYLYAQKDAGTEDYRLNMIDKT